MAMKIFTCRCETILKIVLYVSLALFAASSAVYANCSGHGSCETSTPYDFHPPRLPKPSFEFVFYMHDQLITPTNRSAYAVTLPVAKVDNFTLSDQSWLLDVNASWFGTIVVFEDSLTIAPAVNSTEIGKAIAPAVNSTEIGKGRGIYVFDKNLGAENENQGVEWIWTAIFSERSGLANSTLCFKGWDLFKESVAGVTEVTICGGTGKFRLARGFAKISIALIDAVSAALKYDVSIFF
ncbi:hypothetical protein Mapa_011993 [Marchantia paleacea]|nr:hypothetical protein Mapa_011993 [Marchantia paleacea]